jgi:transcriptional regulator with XRE-family HTH domain
MLTPKTSLDHSITNYRKKLGLKQKDLAELVGSKPKYISAIEKGWAEPSVLMLARIAAALEITLHELTKKE